MRKTKINKATKYVIEHPTLSQIKSGLKSLADEMGGELKFKRDNDFDEPHMKGYYVNIITDESRYNIVVKLPIRDRIEPYIGATYTDTVEGKGDDLDDGLLNSEQFDFIKKQIKHHHETGERLLD